MLIDYSDPSERHYLLVKIKVAIDDIVYDLVRQAKAAEGEVLEGSKLVIAAGEVFDYLDENLTIEFKDE